MTEATQQTRGWVGQIVDGTFPLREFLGETEHSAVFLTEYGEGAPQKAVIKLVAAETETADQLLANWNSAAQLSHPNILRLFRAGRCTFAGHDVLYLAMEYAEENLSQILPERALTPEETREMLSPVLDALEYLHGEGLVHGDLKPANILATGDRLKLSSDTISRIGERQVSFRRPGPYDPPEAISGMLTPAADVWLLGTTLIEVLTQRLPDWQPGPNREPVVPANLPEPFREIARQSLGLEPQKRASLGELAARLTSRAAVASASAGASVSQLAGAPSAVAAAGVVPSVAPKAMTSQIRPPMAAARLQTGPHRPPPYKGPGAKSKFIVPLIVAAVLFAAIVTVPRLLTHRTGSQSNLVVARASQPGPAEAPRSAEHAVSSTHKTKAERKPAVSEPANSATSGRPAEVQSKDAAAAPESLKTTSEREQPAVAVPSTASAGSAGSAKTTAGSVAAKGDVLDQVLPEVSAKARNTIRGRVRVGIKVHVDAAGAVTDADFASPGPSKFFADLALKAANKWVFTPPEVNGKSVPSEWSLRFVFTQKDTKVIPTQTVP